MSMRISVDTRAVDRMLARAPQVLRDALEAATEDAMADLHVQMQTYPPQRPGTPYERTSTLKASWIKHRAQWSGNTVTGRVESAGMSMKGRRRTPYNVYVQKADMQAWMHRGIWTNTDRAVIERTRQRIEGYYRQRLARAVASLQR